MVDYTTTDVILKDINGDYLSPYVKKVGTETVGTDDTPIYLDAGTPTVGKKIGITAYDNTKMYDLNDVVLNIKDDMIKLYRSLINNNTSALTDDTKWKEVSLGSGGGEIGDVMFAPLGIDESLNLRRYLNGQVLIQSQFVSFTNKVKSAIALYPNLATTEENWQAEKTNSKLGQCGKFVVDDTAGTIRLPAVVNAQGLIDLALIGGIKNESLPNISGSWHSEVYTYESSGAITRSYGGTNKKAAQSTQNTDYDGFSFDASLSSSTYQDNAPVQQEAVQYPYCIVVNVGTEEADRPINNYQVNNVYSYGMSQYYKGTMNNNSWLKSAGQWNAGTVYTGMYNWLLEQMNAGVSGFVASTAAYTDYDFVINTTDQTFRLPLLNGQEGVFADGVKGNGMTIGLTDGTNSFGLGALSSRPGYLGAIPSFYGENAGISSDGVWGSQGPSLASGLSQDPAKSGMVVDKTVPSGWNLYYYIGDTLQNAQLVNVARIEETLVNKTNKVQAAEASMPSSRYIDLTLGASGSTYTAPANGWFHLVKKANANNQFLYAEVGPGPIYRDTRYASNGQDCSILFPVKKGETALYTYSVGGDTALFRFIYAEGEN